MLLQSMDEPPPPPLPPTATPCMSADELPPLPLLVVINVEPLPKSTIVVAAVVLASPPSAGRCMGGEGGTPSDGPGQVALHPDAREGSGRARLVGSIIQGGNPLHGAGDVGLGPGRCEVADDTRPFMARCHRGDKHGAEIGVVGR